MGEKKKKDWNVQFFSDYDTVRRYLRPISYGCFAPRDIAKLLGSHASSYSHTIQHLRECLPDGSLMDIDELLSAKEQRVQILGDSYRTSSTPFAETYYLRTLSENEIYFYLHLPRFLSLEELTPTDRQSAKIRGRINGRAPGRSSQKKETASDETSADFDAVSWIPTYQLHLPPEEKDPGTRAQMADDAKQPYWDKPNGFDTRSIQGYLEELVRRGYLCHTGKKGKPSYQVTEDVLAGLSTAELATLRFAVDFYREISPLQVPGYFLSSQLGWRTGQPEIERPFQIVGGDPRRIIDDDIIYKVLQAIELDEEIEFLYREPTWRESRDAKKTADQASEAQEWDKEYFYWKRKYPGLAEIFRRDHPRPEVDEHYRHAFPAAITIDDLAGGRQQLIDVHGNAYRLEDIRNVRPHTRNDAPPLKARKPSERKLEFLLHARDDAHEEALCRSVQHHLGDVTVTREADHILHCTMRCGNDLLRQLPLLRQYLPFIEILATDPNARDLRRRMKDSIEEALAHYEEG